MEGFSPPDNDFCSICHSNFNIPVQANCSHWFCGSCVMLLWNHGSTFQPCKCPLCRRQITLLVPTEASMRECHDPEIAEILRQISAYNRHFGGQENNLIQRMRDLPFLLRRLAREMLDPQRSLPLVIRARVYLAVECIFAGDKYGDYATNVQMILSAAYILSPVDFIPEGILGIVGFLDDAIILLLCFLHVAAIYRSVLYFRHGGS